MGPRDPLIVFVEVVATDGPVTEQRRQALAGLAPGFRPDQTAFVTAYLDRDAAALKKTAARLAWDTFAWFVSDPDGILLLRGNAAPSKRWLWEILQAGRVP